MRLLIDTHTFVWYTGDGAKLPSYTRNLIAADDTDVVMSIASLWELSIKVALGRLDVDGGFENLPAVLTNFDIEMLEVRFEHTLKQSHLPFHHKDPFDRMIAAQALVEKIDLVSVDDVFDQYFAGSEVKRMW